MVIFLVSGFFVCVLLLLFLFVWLVGCFSCMHWYTMRTFYRYFFSVSSSLLSSSVWWILSISVSHIFNPTSSIQGDSCMLPGFYYLHYSLGTFSRQWSEPVVGLYFSACQHLGLITLLCDIQYLEKPLVQLFYLFCDYFRSRLNPVPAFSSWSEKVSSPSFKLKFYQLRQGLLWTFLPFFPLTSPTIAFLPYVLYIHSPNLLAHFNYLYTCSLLLLLNNFIHPSMDFYNPRNYVHDT